MRDWPLMQWSKEQLLQQVGDALFKVSKPTGEAAGRAAPAWPCAVPPASHASRRFRTLPGRQCMHQGIVHGKQYKQHWTTPT
jgi:hypothetical protein